MKYVEREIEIQSSLNNRNIIRLFSQIKDGPIINLVLEYASNGSLFEYLQKNRILSDKQIAFIFKEICLGIQYLHSFGIIHRDIKLENILFDEHYNLKLADFGFACYDDQKVVRKTMCGTKEYFAPEIFRGKQQNRKLDVWCLGVLLYELCHNNTPFVLRGIEFEEAINVLKQKKYM